MSEAARQLPWSIRLYELRSLPPLLWACVVTLAYLGLWFCVARLEGRPPLWGSWSWSEAVVRGMLLGYTPALMVWSRRQALRTLHELRPALRLPDERFPGIVAATFRPPRWLLYACASVALVWPLLALRTALLGGPVVAGESTPAGRLWVGVTFMVAGWLVARAVAQDVHVARSLSRLGAEALEIDLLAPERLEPLHRWSLRAVALWVIWFCIMSLFFVGPGPANYINLGGIAPLLIVSGTAFFLPLYGAHRRIRETKRAELAWLDERLRQERDALRENRSGGAGARLADLAAYRGLVARAREWPFDATTLLRFALYTAVGVGSWLGAALVERGLGVLLD